jgi:geranylgeranyl pyrophosphate synthase
MQYYFTEIENYIMKTQILEYPEDIQDKVIYSLQDGKRLRPILCIIFSGLENNNLESLEKYKEKKLFHSIEINISNDEKKKIIYSVSAFIEHIHCLSLILDDLPEMDNDSMRRGKQSFHSKYNIDYTNFFIYYMFNRLSLSLNSILDTYIDNNININLNPKNRNTLNNNIKFANKIKKLLSTNLNILLDGQFNDLSSSSSSSFLEKSRTKKQDCSFLEKQDLKNPARKPRALEGLKPSQFKYEIELILDFLENIELEETTELSQLIINNIELNMKKTSSLFNLSICSGFLLQIWLKKYDLENYKHIYEKLRIWSNILGYMFQISDDILDIDDDAEKHNPNICQIISKDNTSMLLQNGCEWLLENIKLLILECNLDINMNMNMNMNTNTNTNTKLNINKKIYINLDSIKEIIDKILKRIENT